MTGPLSKCSFVLTLALLSWAAAPMTKDAAAAPPRDEQLRQAILARFSKSKSAAEGWQVSVRGGVATITGNTGVPQRKGSATRMAKAAGARDVINKIQVSKEGREKAAASLRKAQVHRGEPRDKR
ncbi:MAG: BON domain-containing protein [Bryobacteraceae bacterium]|nr:BON domain-containing protein [Bryobacteraceae bacterium]